MGGVSPEEIAQAREMDLLTYLQNYEPYELVHVSGNTYSTKTHDSLKISNGKWMWFSRGFGGRSALDYLIKVKGYSFIDAVRTINKQEVIKSPVFVCKKPKEKKLILPKKNISNDRVISYLHHRGIDNELIRHCIKEGYIYETFPHHNVVFIGFDENKIPKYAGYRSTNNKRFLGDAEGSDKRYSFKLLGEDRENIHVFESAIDLLSYATLMKLNGGDWQKENLLSLAGVYGMKAEDSKLPEALQKVLSERKSIKRIYLNFDNDNAGRISAAGIKNMLADSYEVCYMPPPNGKDFNDYLCLQLGIGKEKKTERSDEFGR